jgi:glucokinase
MGDDRGMFIAADIGGTKSRFGLYDPTVGAAHPVRVANLPTAGAPDPGDLVAEFAGSDRFDAVSLAVAGAVVDERARGSNLPWDLDAKALSDRFHCPVRLLNDLEAIATFVPHATAAELEVLQAGIPVAGGPIGVIAPGTGIGEALLFMEADGNYRARPSEAGHLDFAPNNARQDAWLAYLRARHGHVSLERACSGTSLPVMYEFLRDTTDLVADAATATRLEEGDAAAAVTKAALGGACPVCEAALEMFVDILAAAAGDLALQIVATGGIVLAGGIPPRILPALRGDRFRAAFSHKGRFAHLTERTPVAVLLNEAAGLAGAAHAHLHDPSR